MLRFFMMLKNYKFAVQIFFIVSIPLVVQSNDANACYDVVILVIIKYLLIIQKCCSPVYV